MKKIGLVIFMGLFLSFNITAQKGKFYGKIKYEQTQRNPSLITFEAILFFDNNNSYYEWFSRNNGVEKINDGTTIYHSNSEKVFGLPNFILNRYMNKELFIGLIDGDEEYLIKEDSTFLKWALINETKKIDQFLCQKAITNFRGKNYIAWFTSEIPIPYGPHKLHGLGGLILEAYEENYLIYFLAKEINVGSSTYDIDNKIKAIDFTKSITAEDYDNKVNKRIENLEKVLSSRSPKGSNPIKFKDNCEDCSKKIENKQ
ncbi:MAG: GLPGLI family protein [Flavobacteriaceae bacterium]|nr:GLPGLI family protein [Flavobacteriaceae bacterium]